MKALLITYHVVGSRRSAFFTQLWKWLAEMRFHVDVFTYPYYLADTILRRNDRNNFRNLIKLMKGSQEKSLIRNFTIPKVIYFRILRHLPDKVKEIIYCPRKLESLLRKEQYDIIFFESTIGVCFYNSIRNINPCAKIIYRPSDPLCFVPPYKYDNVLLKREKKITEEADMVLFPSEEIKQLMLRKYEINDVPNKMIILHNPVENVVFENRSLKPLPKRKKRAIYAGFFPIDWSLIKLLARRFKDYEFIILGLKAGINESNISIPGALSFEKVLELVSESRIGIIPYKRLGEINDLFTLTKKVILMMKAKIPIVAQNVSHEIAKHGIILAKSQEDFIQKFSQLTKLLDTKNFFEYDEKIFQDYHENFVKLKFKKTILDLMNREKFGENL